MAQTFDIERYRNLKPAVEDTAYMKALMETPEVAQPRSGSVRDAYGDPCPAALTFDLYPLSGRCENCGADVRCVDPTADWFHKRTRRVACSR